MPAYTIVVNGETHDVDVPADMPLLWVLRDVLGLTGTKFGCGIARCGACTVQIAGEAVRSCRQRIATVTEPVTTIEGLAEGGLHEVQEAWIEAEVPQCGYCQPGMVMTAAAFLEGSPKPTREEVDAALSGHICRCGTYDRVRAAMRIATEEGNR